MQIVPKYLSQTWRARSNYCCQPPFKVLLTQVASHLNTSPHTPMQQSDSKARLFRAHQTRITKISMILLTLSFMTFADSSLRATAHFIDLLKKNLSEFTACLFLTFFLLSSSFRLCLVSGVKAVRESVSRTDMVGARSLLMNNLGSHVTLLSILHQILSRKYQIFPT